MEQALHVLHLYGAILLLLLLVVTLFVLTARDHWRRQGRARRFKELKGRFYPDTFIHQRRLERASRGATRKSGLHLPPQEEEQW